MASLARAEQLSDNAAEPAYHRGQVLLQQGELEPAIAAFDRAITRRASYPEAHYSRGLALHRQRQYAAALDAFRQATQLNPTYASAYYSAGVIFAQQRQYDDARRVLDYAQTLFEAQGNSQWADQTAQLLANLP